MTKNKLPLKKLQIGLKITMTFDQSYKKANDWQIKTFGPYYSPKSIIDHIRKELIEIEEEPFILEEWIDLMFLAFAGASRLVKYHSPKLSSEDTVSVVRSAFDSKLKKNKARTWP